MPACPLARATTQLFSSTSSSQWCAECSPLGESGGGYTWTTYCSRLGVKGDCVRLLGTAWYFFDERASLWERKARFHARRALAFLASKFLGGPLRT